MAAGGGDGLAAARATDPIDVRGEVDSSGLRGRGGAGFPTGTKWQTGADAGATTVVVNAAEGEPGTFKDRMLIRRNPFRAIEGALIAAHAVGARRVVVAVGGSFNRERRRLGRAIAECEAAGWGDGVEIELVAGPDAYLFGEETGLLEVLDGRQPFPRVTPPYRTADGAVLVNNLETLANIPDIIERGAAWFREVGTEQSPGTVVCTVSGDMVNHGVGEFELGTPLIDVLTDLGWRIGQGRRVLGVLSGTANPIIPADLLETPLTHDNFTSVGIGMGSCGFIVFDDRRDPVAIAEGVSRFLAVESCGQCEPCKRDGLAISEHLAALAASEGNAQTIGDLNRRLGTVADGARCGLARQQQAVVGSILRLFPDAVTEHQERRRLAAAPVAIAPMADLVGGRAVPDERQYTKQPDWTHDDSDSLAFPAARLAGTPVEIDRSSAEQPDDEPRVGPFSEDPEQLVDATHDHLAALLEDFRRDPDRATAATLAQELRDHVDMTRQILAPMVARHAGADGDDAVAGSTEEDRTLAHLAAQLTATAVSGDDEGSDEATTELIDRFHRHVENEHHMLDVLLPVMEPDQRRDLARAMVDATLSEGDQP